MQAEQKTKEKENLDEDFHSRLHEVTKFTLNKSGVRSYGDGTAFLSKTKKEEGNLFFLKHGTQLKMIKMKKIFYLLL